jgi:uncharacterized protein (DUF305 family)
MHRRICRAAALAAVALLAAAPTAAQAKATTVDRAFVREMIPHHQMAVEMARVARMQATHQRIKTTAQDIITAQTSEISRLKEIATRLGVKVSTTSPTHERMMRDAETLGMTMDDMGMEMDMSELDGAKPFDRMFIDMMITHHRGAIRMARAELSKGTDAGLRTIARAIVSAQKREVIEMNAWRKQWYGATSPSGGVPRP